MGEFNITTVELDTIARKIYDFMNPTPQYNWPLLSQRVGADVWVKHENHTPTGAFKVRGGLIYVDELLQKSLDVVEFVAATRGNHGQSVACAVSQKNLKCKIVVPHGNSIEKNNAMSSQGGELIVSGADFQESLEFAYDLADKKNMHFFPSFHPVLVKGVATYAWELFSKINDLDTVYVPIGMGSGVCGVIAVRDAMNLSTKVVGVVAENAPTYALSFKNRKTTSTNSAETIADGLACRTPNEEALAVILSGAERIVTVTENEIKAAIRYYFTDTHNVAEGAGAAGLAALIKEKSHMIGKRVGLILSGGNIDSSVYQSILQEHENEDQDN